VVDGKVVDYNENGVIDEYDTKDAKRKRDELYDSGESDDDDGQGTGGQPPQDNPSQEANPSQEEIPTQPPAATLESFIELMNPLAASIIEDPIHLVGGFEQINSMGQAAHQAWNNLPGNDQGDGTFLHAWTEALAGLYEGIEFLQLSNALRRDGNLDGYDDAAPFTRRHLHADYDQHYTHPTAWTKPTDTLLALLVTTNAEKTALNNNAQMAANALNTWELQLAAHEVNLAAMLYIKDEAARILGLSVDTDREWFRIAQLADFTIIYDSALLGRNNRRDNPPWSDDDLVYIQATMAANSLLNTDAIAAAEALPTYDEQVSALLANVNAMTALLTTAQASLDAVIPYYVWRYDSIVAQLNLDIILAQSTYSTLAMNPPYVPPTAEEIAQAARDTWVANQVIQATDLADRNGQAVIIHNKPDFRLVRYLPPGASHWHAQNDDLVGTAVAVGTYGDQNNRFNIPFESIRVAENFVEYFIANGDFSEWALIERSTLSSFTGSGTQMSLLKSSRSATTHTVGVYQRSDQVGNGHDPTIGLATDWEDYVIYSENSRADARYTQYSEGNLVFVR